MALKIEAPLKETIIYIDLCGSKLTHVTTEHLKLAIKMQCKWKIHTEFQRLSIKKYKMSQYILIGYMLEMTMAYFITWNIY
jgi:hypothetical protein